MNDEFGADICMPYRDSLTHNNKNLFVGFVRWSVLIRRHSWCVRVCVLFLIFYLFNFVMKICRSCTHSLTHTHPWTSTEHITSIQIRTFTCSALLIAYSTPQKNEQTNLVCMRVFLLSKIYGTAHTQYTAWEFHISRRNLLLLIDSLCMPPSCKVENYMAKH